MPKKIQKTVLTQPKQVAPHMQPAQIMHVEPQIMKQPLNKSGKYVIPGLVLATLLGIVGTGIGYNYLNKQSLALDASQKKLAILEQDPNIQAKEQQSALIQKVAALVDLPQDEQPTIATITDLSKLKDQAFFATAQLQDKVLIYPNAKKAILYRPSVNKIIEIAPLNLTKSPSNNPAVLGASSGNTGTPDNAQAISPTPNSVDSSSQSTP